MPSIGYRESPQSCPTKRSVYQQTAGCNDLVDGAGHRICPMHRHVARRQPQPGHYCGRPAGGIVSVCGRRVQFPVGGGDPRRGHGLGCIEAWPVDAANLRSFFLDHRRGYLGEMDGELPVPAWPGNLWLLSGDDSTGNGGFSAHRSLTWNDQILFLFVSQRSGDSARFAASGRMNVGMEEALVHGFGVR